MSKSFMSLLKPVSLFLIRTLLVLSIIIMFALVGLIIRLSQGPIDLAFAKHHIENAASDPANNYQVVLDKLLLTWPDLKSSMQLDLGRVQVKQVDSKLSDTTKDLTINNVSIGLLGSDFLEGRFLNFSVIIDSPRIPLSREEGLITLFSEPEQKKEIPKAQPINIAEEIFTQMDAEFFDLELEPIEVEYIAPPKDVQELEPTSKSIKSAREQIKVVLQKLADPSYQDALILSFIKEIRIKKALITAEKAENKNSQREAQKGYIALADLNLRRHKEGIEGDLDVILPSDDEADRKASLKADILYRREQQDLTFTSFIKGINPVKFSNFFPELKILHEQNLILEGEVLTAFDSDLRLKDASLILRIPQGQIVSKKYDAPIEIKDFIFQATSIRDLGQLEIKKLNATIADIPFKISTTTTIQKNKITAPIKLTIDKFAADNLVKLFPKSQYDTVAGKWMTQRLKDGYFVDVLASTNIEIKRDTKDGLPKLIMSDTQASFKAEDMTVKYSSTLMPTTNVYASGTYKNDRLEIMGDRANIADVKGTDVKVILNKVSVAGDGDAHVTLKAKGPLKTVFDYISDEPILMGQKLGFDGTKAKGDAEFNLDLKFPLLKDLPKEEVIVVVDGKVNDLLLPNIVKGMNLTGGPYDLSYKAGMINLKGNGQFNGYPIELDYAENISDPSKDFDTKITGKLKTDNALRRKFGINLDEYVIGDLPVDFTYQSKNKKAVIDVKGNLKPTLLSIKPFRYNKPSAIEGALSLKAHLENDYLKEIDNLSIKTTNLILENGRLLFAQDAEKETDLKRGNLPKLNIGRTNISTEFEVIPGSLLKIVAKGPAFDALPFMNSSDQPKSELESVNSSNANNKDDELPMEISLTADQLFLKNNQSFRNIQLYLKTDKESDPIHIEMDAQAGAGPMYVRFKPNPSNGERQFISESQDGGAVLRGLGIYKHIRGGKLSIVGRPKRGDERGDLSGVANLSDFKVVNAPVLAKLLDAMSVKGVKNIMKEDEIFFTKLNSKFEWRFRDGGNLLVLKDGRTSGSAVGLTFEGLVDQRDDNVDISGTIIPISNVNTALSKVPIIGDIIGGKDTALFAATYSLKGMTADPKVVVNPLSVLAPGFIRKILFEDSVEQKLEKKDKEE